MAEPRASIPAGWYTAGPDVLWGLRRHTTFAFVPPEGLPELPRVPMDGSFSWLPALAPHWSPLHYDDALGGATEGLARLDRLQAAAIRRGLALPEPFVRFMAAQPIHSRVPSITGCYLDLSDRLLDDMSDRHGPFLRFLADSQECVAWYLQLAADGGSRVVAAWHLHHNADDELVPDAGRAHVVAATFESFVYRFWLENILWFKVTNKQPLTAEERDYLAAGRRAVSLVESANEEDE